MTLILIEPSAGVELWSPAIDHDDNTTHLPLDVCRIESLSSFLSLSSDNYYSLPSVAIKSSSVICLSADTISRLILDMQ